MRIPRIESKWTIVLVIAAVLVTATSLIGCSDSASPTEPVADSNPAPGSGDSNAGDSDDSGGSDSGDGSATSGTLAIQMIDDPTDDICELWVYIQDLRVKPDGDSPILLGSEIGAYELLALQEGPPAPLGEWVVEGGLYQFIEILLDESQSHVIEKDPDDPGDAENPNCLTTTTPLQIPSAKFKVNGGPFTVGPETRITIDFDAKNSLKRKGSANNPKGWQLKPKVSIVDVEQE